MNDETNWFNQQLVYFKDNQFGTNSTIDISLSCNTQEYINFTSPTFNLRIYSQENKCYTYNLKYIDVTDLLNSIQQLLNNVDEIYNSNSNNNSIYKVYINSKNLQITFKSSMSKEWCVVLAIINTKTDYGRIIIPYNLFLNIFELLKNYRDNFLKICFDFSSRSLLTNILNENKNILNSIKILSTNVINVNDNNNIQNKEKDNLEMIDKSNQQLEFENFLNENINDVSILEIDKDKNNIQINNLFLEKVFNNSIENIENYFNTLWICNNPIKELTEKIYNNYQFKEENMNLLDTFFPDISLNDYKSITYMTKFYFSLYLKLYMDKQNSIPAGTPIFKYNIKNKNMISQENIDLSYDLLLIMSYIKLFRDKYKDKEEDLSKNKTIFYFCIRCFTDVFIFSFLHGKDENSILNCISERYKYYDNKGIFNSYNNVLKSYNLNKIELGDIKSFLQNSIFKNLNKPLYINILHDEHYDNKKVKLPYKNNFDLEQIINDIINIEINLRTEKTINVNNIENQQIKELFIEKSEEKESNILRFIKKNINDIPLKYQKDFILYINDNLNNNKFDFNQTIFPLNEFNDIIIKSLHIWDPINDEKQRINYSYFVEKISSSKMTKDLILISNINNKYNNENKDNDWTNSLKNISLNL